MCGESEKSNLKEEEHHSSCSMVKEVLEERRRCRKNGIGEPCCT
jgi:hypothetical protein